MQKVNIIESAIEILRNDLMENGELLVSITQLGFLDTRSSEYIGAEFSGINASVYDEGFYYHVLEGKYYYYGEAITENPGSFSNKFGFEIEKDDLQLIPEALRSILKQVALSGESFTIRSEDSSILAITDTPILPAR
jgi:hypothetical protein